MTSISAGPIPRHRALRIVSRCATPQKWKTVPNAILCDDVLCGLQEAKFLSGNALLVRTEGANSLVGLDHPDGVADNGRGRSWSRSAGQKKGRTNGYYLQ